MMSLGTWKARSTKYQRFLNLSQVFLLITSIILIFAAAILIKFYHITKLNFWSTWFYVTPVLMVSLGVYTFTVSVYGFLISNQEHRGLISLMAVFMGIAFLAQIFSIFTAMEIRNFIERGIWDQGKVRDSMEFYGEENHEDITEMWDEMQTELRCCGGDRFDLGYRDWRSSNIGLHNKSVPDSCCHKPHKDCGEGLAVGREEQVSLGIYKDGCIAILKQKLKTDVEPMMIVYSCVGVLLAIVELITVVLACAYVAQISRRRRRDELFSRVGNAAQDDEYLPSLTSQKETNF
jgi:hypothetical protein